MQTGLSWETRAGPWGPHRNWRGTPSFLLQLENNHEILPSMRDEDFFHCNVSSEIPPSLLSLERVLDTLDATQEVPRHTRLHSRGSMKVPHTSRGAPFPPPSSRWGILSLFRRERIPGVPVASQENALSTGKARWTPGSCHHFKSP